VRVTNWLILPLRRVLPPIGKLDTATVLAVFCAAAAQRAAILALGGFGYGDPVSFVLASIIGLVALVLRIYLFALLLYWLTRAVGTDPYAPGARLLGQLCEPVLKPVRRVIPPIGRVDFSVLWVSIAIGAVLAILS
jgi:YggT family protein